MRVPKIAILLIALLAVAATTGLVAQQTVTLMHDKGGNPDYRPFYDALGAAAQQAIGVGISQTPYPSTDVFMSTVRAALPTKQAPELFTWWSTYRMKDLIDQGLCADLTDLWNKHKADFSAGVRNAFTFDGKVYGIPYSIEYWGVWYNKTTFKKLNLSVPTTWAQFLKVCDALKAAGVTPMAQSVQGRWPAFIMFEEMVARQDPQLYEDLCAGKARYTDPRVKTAFTVWADLINKGYFTDASTDLFSDTPRLFQQGQVGMVPIGSWYYTTLTSSGVADADCGFFVMPPPNPKVGKVAIMEAAPIVVAKNSPNLAAARKLIDWMMTPAGSAVLPKALNQFPPTLTADTSFLPKVKVDLAAMLVKDKYRILNRYWEATPTPICESAVDKFAEFILDTSKLDSVLADLDKLATDYWSTHKQ
jgi:multiple sugar transport system substrate-binding protein/raffinose/stachyose/melibiose transport system substrate-binding protein